MSKDKPKKNPQDTNATGKQEKTDAPASAAPAVAKVTKPAAPIIPLTPKQQAAKDAMDAANKEAQDELRAKSKEVLEAAEKKVAESSAALKQAHAELKTLQLACGIVPVKGKGGAKKAANHFTHVKTPERGAPQMLGILEIVKSHGAAGIAREALVKQMETDLPANMDRSRLLSFYTKEIREEGYCIVT